MKVSGSCSQPRNHLDESRDKLSQVEEIVVRCREFILKVVNLSREGALQAGGRCVVALSHYQPQSSSK